VALLTTTTRPRVWTEVSARQEQGEGEHNDEAEPKNWISSVEHGQNCNQCCANYCTFKPNGKRGVTRWDFTNLSVVLQTLCGLALKLVDDFNGRSVEKSRRPS
jgi:hypothetical protein